jgi:hypothetical protein
MARRSPGVVDAGLPGGVDDPAGRQRQCQHPGLDVEELQAHAGQKADVEAPRVGLGQHRAAAPLSRQASHSM